MVMHLEFVNLRLTVASDDDSTNNMSKAKMTAQIGFISLCTVYALILSKF